MSQEPPDYQQSFARKMIDAGADAYVGHGPHLPRGIEIYKGRPIFYSLGNFFYDDLRTPAGLTCSRPTGRARGSTQMPRRRSTRRQKDILRQKDL
nr:CapA family protein [Mesorhizobium sp. ZC-5]